MAHQHQQHQRQQQPSLEAKKAYFAHLRTWSQADDEKDADRGRGDDYDDDDNGDDNNGRDDELEPREQRMRRRHKRFFRRLSPPREASSPPNPVAAVPGTSDEEKEEEEVIVVMTTPAAPHKKRKKRKKPVRADGGSNSSGSSSSNVVVVDALLGRDGDGDVEIVGETPLETTKRLRASSAAAAVAVQSASPTPRTSRTLRPPRLTRSAVSSSSASSLLASAAKKRKKDDGQATTTATTRPREEQIFQGLVFYYVPDNAIAPARRLRMQKAREYGAARTSDPARATHVIVDRDVGYPDAERAVAQAAAAAAAAVKTGRDGTGGGGVVPEGLVIVNEDYPIECVQFRALLDWTQKRYRLVGEQPERDSVRNDEVVGEAEEEREESTLTSANEEKKMKKALLQVEEPLKTSTREKLLQLKEPQQNPKKWDYAPPKSTPPNSNEEEASPSIDSQPTVLDGAGKSEEGPGDCGPGTRAESAKQDGTATATATVTTLGDELTRAIDMMQEFKDLPLDHDDDNDDTVSTAADPGPGSDDGSDSSSDSDSAQRRRPPADGKKASSPGAFEARFACVRSGGLDAHLDNKQQPNARTIEVLQSMQSYYERTGDAWRVLAYRRAITTLRRHPVRVSSERAARRLPGVGPRLAAKIAEIATTDRLRRLEHAQRDDGGEDAALRLFLGVHGVGPAVAGRWAARGLRTLDDVQRAAAAGGTGTASLTLTPAQRLGMERYDDLNTRIPRDEVEALAGVVRAAAARVDPEVALVVGGSYRRGAPSSGDVDLIVTKAGTTREAQLRPFLGALVARLQEAGFLVATLAADGNIWQGCCVLPPGESGDGRGGGRGGIWRRIDLLLVPETQMGAALIYFTGDDVFNRSMRLLARRKGMKLNQRGLYAREGGSAGTGTAGEEVLLEGRCERRIFEILGVQWREPTQRWC
ncbi:hypothetical protein V2A60_007810 [Cordyceps javanica]